MTIDSRHLKDQAHKPHNPADARSFARLISITGGAAAYLALNFTIYKRTGSAAWVAAALFLTFGMTGFVSPFAGALGDRFDVWQILWLLADQRHVDRVPFPLVRRGRCRLRR